MSLIQTYSNLLKDSEIDVKIEAVKHLSNFVKIVAADKISLLLPQVLALGKDQLATVRCTFSSYFSLCWRYFEEHAGIDFEGSVLSISSAFNQRFNEG